MWPGNPGEAEPGPGLLFIRRGTFELRPPLKLVSFLTVGGDATARSGVAAGGEAWKLARGKRLEEEEVSLIMMGIRARGRC